MVEPDKKRELIIEGAIRRFSHFGINKTTMAEIAEDLSVSKPSLYYYFPDKHSLITAVAEKIISEFISEIEAGLEKTTNTEETLINMIEKHRNFFEKYYMLHMGEEYSENYLKDPEILKVVKEAKEKEVGIISKCLQTGIKRGEFKEFDTLKTAELISDTLIGLRVCMKLEKHLLPDAKELDVLITKQKNVVKIFLNGLKKH
jgi:TetR/AcrR family transcriptional repressor of mexJK operon